MLYLKWVVSAVIVAAAQLAAAQGQTTANVTQEPGKATVTGMHKVTATITKIDADTRTVTLKRHDGKLVEAELGPEVRNFDQLKVGDVVTMTYKESLTLSLKKGGDGETSVQQTPQVERAAAGEKPGGMIGREVKVTANVVAVDAKTQTVTLMGPEGGTMDLRVEDPQKLAGVQVGDQVEAVYTEAFAVSVKPAAHK
ncbi:copper-binding protein [Paraburkholderia sp. CNPSo 3272]|uniref:copper-binding protein n=1 Tax=Paraburkholderia sp. CNPSo 3272 TaxID=2940931 RepID=UPI0020B7D405|nr:copper-binding protein [Paraburkholderia sp. CNPSo 3272]MCP3722670.1 copper-binding protein [Paraburkholderia sp. CNPSo 3272]